ncbi:MAG: transposase, partial [Acidimicrobiales bacterium]
MTLGTTPTQGDLLRSTVQFCQGRVGEDSIYAVLHRECFNLFPDELFADLFTDVGRRSVPPMIVATTMVLQRIEGLSDREAVDRFAFDARWKYAAGGLAFDYPGFVHTVLVDMRARLAGSQRPNRIFQATLQAAKAAGLVGRKRVLDSTPLYDAVATMDTVTLVRSAIRGLLKVADAELEAELRALLRRDDDYTGAGKPACDWDDPAAREALVDALARDARALLGCLDGGELDPPVAQAATLLATVAGQDIDEDADGVFRIARRVARDRVISTVDPQARHGHKTSARGFDGYKGHLAIDPDSEIITATTATPGNTGDAEAAADLLADDLPTTATDDADGDAGEADADAEDEMQAEAAEDEDEPLGVYGDAAYGAGGLLEELERAGADIHTKVQPPSAPGGRLPKDRFDIDQDAGTVTCPGQVTVPIRPAQAGGGTAVF